MEHVFDLIGRLHVLVLHFPIALLITAAVFEFGSLLAGRLGRGSDHAAEASSSTRVGADRAALAILALGTFTAVLAGVTGWVLGSGRGDTVSLHRWVGIAATLASAGALTFALVSLRAERGRAMYAYRVGLIGAATLVSAAGHLGGELTHGRGFLAEPLRRLFGNQPGAPSIEHSPFDTRSAAARSFEGSVLPLFERSCVGCHGPRRSEGGLRLDSLAHVLNSDVAAGSAGDSELIYRLELPRDDADAMPPEGEDVGLSSEEVELIRTWIEQLD